MANRNECLSDFSTKNRRGWPWGRSRDAPPPPPESGRTDGRTFARSYADVITKFSRVDGLPIFLTHGASLARFARWSSAIMLARDWSKPRHVTEMCLSLNWEISEWYSLVFKTARVAKNIWTIINTVWGPFDTKVCPDTNVVLWYCLFFKAHSFPRGTVSENCSFLHRQVSVHIFLPNRDSVK